MKRKIHQKTFKAQTKNYIALTSLKYVMRDNPFLTIPISPKFSTCQEEETPTDVPKLLFSLTIGFFQHWLQFTIFPISI